MAKRMSRRTTKRALSRKQVTWLEMAQQSECPDTLVFTIPLGRCTSDVQGFTLLDEIELDRFEEDLTILRIVGSIHFRLQTLTDPPPGGARIKWGLIKQLSDPAENVLAIAPYDLDALELPWLTVREIVLPNSGTLTPLQDQFASWSYPFNAMQAHVDITVKRKFETHEQLNIWVQAGQVVTIAGQTAPIIFDVAFDAHLRCLIQHD